MALNSTHTQALPSFPILVRQARTRLGYDLLTTARAAGCSESYVSLIEADKRLPSEELGVRLARALHIDPTEALLALLRSRLPAGSRGLLDPGTLLRDAAARFSVARGFLIDQLNVRVPRVRSRLELAWSGDAVIHHLFEELTPVLGKPPLKELVVRDPLDHPGVEVVNRNPKPHVTAAPRGLHFEYEARAEAGQFVHILSFPSGYSPAEAEGGLSFELRLELKRAYPADVRAAIAPGLPAARNRPLSSCFPRFVAAGIDELRIEVRFPDRYRAGDVAALAWIGDGPAGDVADNLIDAGVCRRHELAFEGTAAVLTVHDPLPHYSYGIVWRPMERAAAIDARLFR